VNLSDAKMIFLGGIMSKPTLKDIAKAAGVSHGTVSNVLNGKGNVSIKKMQLVEEVAQKLGYNINYTAKTLRSGYTNAIALVLPGIDSEEYVQMYEGLDKTLTKLGYRTHLYTTYDLQHSEKDILKEIAAERVTGIVTISCLNNADYYYKELSLPKENIIFVNRKIKNAKKFISFDFTEAGKEINEYLLSKNCESIGVFADQPQYEQQFVELIIGGLNPDQVKYVHSPYNQCYSKAFEFFEGEPMDIIVTTSLSKANMMKKAGFWGSAHHTPLILCLAPTQSIFDDKIIKYEQNYHLLGSRIADLLVNQVNSNQKMANVITFKNNGITKLESYSKPDTKNKLTMLTIPSPTTDALKRLLPNFEKRTGIVVELTVKPYEEIYQNLANSVNHRDYDIIRMDMAWLSWFGKDVFLPLDQLDRSLDKIISEYPGHIKSNYSEIHGVSYALPFDPSVQMLFYRKDVFEDQKIKRMYFEKYKKHLELPEDYDSYNELMNFFTGPSFKNPSIKYGSSTILGRSEIIASEFLTRYYALEGKLLNSQGEVTLDFEKAVRAVNNYLNMVNLSQRIDDTWWGEAVNSFARGETAMILGFMNHVSRIAHSDIGTLIGFSPVPGNKPLLGGGVVGITKDSHKISEAVSFLNWVNETETAEQITLLGGTSANQKLYENRTICMLYPWLEGAIKANSNGIRDTVTRDGRRLNTRTIEQIIGKSIKEILNNEVDIETGVQNINNDLAESKVKIIRV
jgi:multiple sugar transport system substrate-binding protein